MKFKKVMAVILIFCLGVCLTGCNKTKKDSVEETKKTEEQNTGDSSDKQSSLSSLVTKGEVKNQFRKPVKGEEYVVMKIKNFGTIKFTLFPEIAPRAVKNFKDFVKEGRYDGGTFHRVIKDFMIQTGKEADEKGEIKKSAVELNPSVHHFNGAVGMARSTSKTQGQGCQFYFVSSEQGKNADFNEIEKTTNNSNKAENLNISVKFDENTKKLYKEHGGRPDLDMLYTIIGQVFEGQDVVDKIAAVPIKEADEKEKQTQTDSVPKDPVIVEKVEIVRA